MALSVPGIIEVTSGKEFPRDKRLWEDEDLVFDRQFSLKAKEAEWKSGLQEARMLRDRTPGWDGATELAGG
jgi:hypothetical protein